MKTIEQVEKFNDKKFQKTFGVNRKTFETMLEVLQEQFQKNKNISNFSDRMRLSKSIGKEVDYVEHNLSRSLFTFK